MENLVLAHLSLSSWKCSATEAAGYKHTQAWKVSLRSPVTSQLRCVVSQLVGCSLEDSLYFALLNLFMRKWQYVITFAPPLTEALTLDVFSFYVSSSLHQEQRKPQEIAAYISRKRNYFTSSPIHRAQKTPVWALASLMTVVMMSRGGFSSCPSASNNLKTGPPRLTGKF